MRGPDLRKRTVQTMNLDEARLFRGRRGILRVKFRDDGCWEWLGALTTAGYGSVRWPDRVTYAHRVAYELFVGPVPEGLVLDHLCRNRSCINPQHLEPVTDAENIRRGSRWATLQDPPRRLGPAPEPEEEEP